MRSLNYIIAMLTTLMVGGLMYAVILMFTGQPNPVLWTFLQKTVMAVVSTVIFWDVLKDSEEWGLPAFEDPPPPPSELSTLEETLAKSDTLVLEITPENIEAFRRIHKDEGFIRVVPPTFPEDRIESGEI